MFKILPSETTVFHSPLRAEICLQNLANQTEEKKPFKLVWKAPVYSKPYIGFIADGEFEIHRNIAYRNSFLPIIQGKITSQLDGSTITVSMRTESYVKVFMAIWLGFTFLFCILALFVSFKARFSPFFIIPFIMAIFGLALSHSAFKYESKQSIEDLKNIFEVK